MGPRLQTTEFQTHRNSECRSLGCTFAAACRPDSGGTSRPVAENERMQCFFVSRKKERLCFTMTYQPAFAGLKTDCAVAVHGGLEKFLRSEVPKKHNAYACSDGENVALERH